jgi:hypothetical protein
MSLYGPWSVGVSPRLRRVAGLLAAALVFVSASVTAEARHRSVVVKAGEMRVPRWAHTATLLADGRVLIVGGYDEVSAEVFDPATERFTVTGSMREPRRMHSATLLPDGKVLVAGGGPLVAEIYDPATGTFSETGSLSTRQMGHTATLLASGKVMIAGGLVLGGEAGKVTAAPAELYDPASGEFERLREYASPGTLYRSGGPVWPQANLLPDGSVLLTGDNPTERFDPEAEQFSLTGEFVDPVFRFGMYWHQSTSLKDGRVLVTGGLDDMSCAGFDRAELYDPETGTFRVVGRTSVPRELHTATLLRDGSVLLAGGGSGGCVTPTIATLERYDPATESFKGAGSMIEPRAAHTATLLRDGRVLLTGGFSYWPRRVLSSAELYRPAEWTGWGRAVRR